MNSEILSVGTELLMGQIANTDAQFLSRGLNELGIGVYYHTVVGDNPERLKQAFAQSLSRSDLVILTGGLGPTPDDLTKETVAEYLRLPLVPHAPSLEAMRTYFQAIGRDMTPNNEKQVWFPVGAQILPNPNGTAPGCMLRQNGKLVVILPGPPRELNPMFTDYVKPLLQELSQRAIVSRFVHVYGYGESQMAAMMGDLLDCANPTLATYVGAGDVVVRVTASAPTKQEAEGMIQPMEDALRSIFGEAIVSFDDRDLAQTVVDLLSRKHKTVACAESCTGGLLSCMLTAVPGASQVFLESFVTYANEAKMSRLGVKEETLRMYGAVSEETVGEMAAGCLAATGADYALAVTGIAGPGGGTPEKPVGLVYAALAGAGFCRVTQRRQNRSRELNRRGAALELLNQLRLELERQP